MMTPVVGGLMGQLGFSEMLVIFIVALLVFGPKKLPELGQISGQRDPGVQKSDGRAEVQLAGPS